MLYQELTVVLGDTSRRSEDESTSWFLPLCMFLH